MEEDYDITDADRERFPHLDDVAENRVASTKGVRAAAIKKFNLFLLYLHNQAGNAGIAQTHNILVLAEVTKPLFGQFVDWMFKIQKVECIGTAEGYLTGAKQFFDKKFKTSDVATDKIWYTGLRTQQLRLYMQRCIDVSF